MSRDATQGSRCPSLIDLCASFISKNLHIIPSIDALPTHLLESIVQQRSNEALTDHDLPVMLAITFQTTPAERLVLLNFRSCLKVSDVAMASAMSYCPALRRVDFSFSELVGDKTMESLSRNCSLLESLSAIGCRQITDTGCTSISQMQSLQDLELELCNKITDIGIQSIVRSRASSLLALNLGDVRQMSNVSIQIIADHCMNLNSISIAGSMKALDLDVEDLCKHCTKLQRLNFRACRRLSDGSLKAISNLLRKQHKTPSNLVSFFASMSHHNETLMRSKMLRELDMGGCSRLSEEAVASLLPLCSSLTRLDLRGCVSLTPRTKSALSTSYRMAQDLVQKYCPNMEDLTLPPSCNAASG